MVSEIGSWLGVRGLDPVKTHVTRPPRIFVELWEIGGLRPEKKARFFLCRGKLLIELAFSAGSRTFALVSRGFETGLLTRESVEKKLLKGQATGVDPCAVAES